MSRTKPKIKLTRIPERDPVRLALDLETAILAMPPIGAVPEIVVGRDLLEDTIATLRRPPIEHPVPDAVLKAWDSLDSAINRVTTALPGQLSAASDNLEQAQRAFRSLIYRLAIDGKT